MTVPFGWRRRAQKAPVFFPLPLPDTSNAYNHRVCRTGVPLLTPPHTRARMCPGEVRGGGGEVPNGGRLWANAVEMTPGGARPTPKATSRGTTGRNYEIRCGSCQVDNHPKTRGQDDQRADSKGHEDLGALGQQAVAETQRFRARRHHVSCQSGLLGQRPAHPGTEGIRPYPGTDT